MSEAKSTVDVLRDLRTLLLKRGWIPTRPGDIPFGAETGPLTLTQALWRAACHGDQVCMGALDRATRALCLSAGLGREGTYPELAGWARPRSQEQVVALIDQAERRWLDAGQEMLRRVKAATEMEEIEDLL